MPSPADWSLKLNIIKLARKNHGWGERENKHVMCPVGSSCRYRGATCSLEHRTDRRNTIEVAECMRAGRTPEEMAKELAKGVERKTRD